MDQTKNTADKILKCGERTYFFDVKEARNGNKYLKITESRFVKEGEERKRNSLTLFKEDIEGFKKIIQEIKLTD
jgi:hypothetical protein